MLNVMPKPLIHVVGIGLAGATSLPPDVLELVQSATVLIGSTRQLDLLGEAATAHLEIWTLGNFTQVFDDLRSRLISHPQTRAVILATGDPLFFGLGRLLLEAFPAEQLVFHPQVSAIQLAFSRLKVPWQDATLVSVHGRGEHLLSAALKRGDRKIAVLTDALLTPSAIAQLIGALDLPIVYQIWVCENLGGTEEQITRYEPSAQTCEQTSDRFRHTFAALNVVVLLRTPEGPMVDSDQHTLDLPVIGLPDAAFKGYADRPTLMTKREIRLLILGAIAPLAHQVIWDIGAGTGSVSVELSRLCPTAQIYAIEKTAMGAELIAENAKHLAIAPIHVVHGTAPDALRDLPLPDRVFIGGSSGQLLSILDWLHKQLHQCKAQHPPRIVLALATIEHLAELTTWINQADIAQVWQHQLTQINISRSLPVGPLTRFSPLNPVTLITLIRY